MATKSKSPSLPTQKSPSPNAAQSNPRQTEDQRWQRTVRFNWDNGGKRGGNKDGRK